MFRYDNQDIVVVNGVVTRRDVAECIATMMGGDAILFPASHAQVIHYLKIQSEHDGTH